MKFGDTLTFLKTKTKIRTVEQKNDVTPLWDSKLASFEMSQSLPLK